MAEASLLSLAGKILGYLGDKAVEKVVSYWGVNDDLKRLEQTMRMIQAMLLDAEKRQAKGEVDAVPKEKFQRLRRVLYQADDLFDEILTVKHQTSQSLKEGNRLNQLAKKVLYPFSKQGLICYNFYVAGEIKSIRKQLDDIKEDLHLDKNGFSLGGSERGEPTPMVRLMNNRETGSSVNPENVVGREHDKNNIIEMLLSESNIAEGNILVISIVGFGGIGKTTLAQLVFSDDRVKNHFELAKWAWVPDVDNKKEVIGKIFRAFTERDYKGLSVEQLQSTICNSIRDKRYLLVLDDIWDESHSNWLDLMSLLGCGKRGSKIIVTTRSFVVASNVRTFPYLLQPLSEVESWDLFQKLALKPGSNSNLIPIGKEIVKNCRNVPLAIRVIGSVLYNKDKEIEWKRFINVQLSQSNQIGSIDIMPTLKLSYDQLPSHLKQCFAYCASFGKGTLFNKNYMVYQWMAQGFIKPSKEDYDLELEDVGDQYFEELLAMNFFQEAIRLDALDNASFKIHDLMFDLAIHVAGEENLIQLVSPMTDEVTQKFHGDLRHVFLTLLPINPWEAPLSFPYGRQMRSLNIFTIPMVTARIQRLDNMLSNFICLRTLQLIGLMIERVPDCLGELRHLRFLKISLCPAIKHLPPSITTLWNLQYLNLEYCTELATLPRGLSRLINLRCLQIEWCNHLTEIPTGFMKLKSLQRLSNFIVGKNNGLDALADMNLRGDLAIGYIRWREDTILEARKANLKGKRLTSLTLQLRCLDITSDDAVSLLEELQPPRCLKELNIIGYQGERLPRWMGGTLHTWLPHLLKVGLNSFKRCRLLSLGFGQLPFLRILELSELTTLEYVEIRGKDFTMNNYFPCLEYLKLSKLPQLRGWSRVAVKEVDDIDGGEIHDDNEEEEEDVYVDNDKSQRPMFPRLSTLEIHECQGLMSMPLMPRLQTFTGKDIHVNLLTGEEAPTCFCSELTVWSLSSVHSLNSLMIDGRYYSLQFLTVSDCRQLMSIAVKSPTSIKNLTIQSCERLREVQGLHHLSSLLEVLLIEDCKELDDLSTSLGCLTTLQILELWKVPKLTALPESIGRLTALHTLRIVFCPQLTFLPNIFHNLTLLRWLTVGGFPQMTSLPDTIGNLTQLRWLAIGDCPKMSSYIGSSSFANHLSHFTLLESLSMTSFPHLTALPVSIVQLSHLREVIIENCPQLKALPDQFTNLTALQKLQISKCPLLSSRCKEPDGQDRPLIQHIPNVILDS